MMMRHQQRGLAALTIGRQKHIRSFIYMSFQCPKHFMRKIFLSLFLPFLVGLQPNLALCYIKFKRLSQNFLVHQLFPQYHQVMTTSPSLRRIGIVSYETVGLFCVKQWVHETVPRLFPKWDEGVSHGCFISKHCFVLFRKQLQKLHVLSSNNHTFFCFILDRKILVWSR